jgi:hypothetical protein
MKLKLTRKRALYLTRLIEIAIDHTDAEWLILAGNGILREIESQRNDLADTATERRKKNDD